MKKINPFLFGTILLTITGLISRLIGFFYRIYLSRLFGEEGMGVYQLIGPILALTFSLTVAGLQTAISKYVAAETNSFCSHSAIHYLINGILMSLVLSFLCTFFLLQFSEQIAVHFLLEPRTASMLRIISLSIPVQAIHSCINGYFYGLKKTAVPAATQLLEQVCRISCVIIASYLASEKNTTPTINAAVIGLVVGEFIASIVSILAVYFHLFRSSKLTKRLFNLSESFLASSLHNSIKLLKLAIPLSMTRVLLNFLQSIEAINIPSMLEKYGYDSVTALSVYGVLTGMALPFIFFPNALTSSVSLMLLPVISEADAAGNKDKLRRTYGKTVSSCLILGSICTLLFLFLGNPIATYLFKSELAGKFIVTLSFICPALYLSTTLSSILHGLGKAGSVFFINISSLLIRLIFVFFFLPNFGILSYIIGMIISQLYTAGLYILVLRKLIN